MSNTVWLQASITDDIWVAPLVARPDAYVQGHRLAPGLTVCIYEDMEDGHLTGPGVVRSWDAAKSAWKIDADPNALEWKAGKTPLPEIPVYPANEAPLALHAANHPVRRFIPELRDLAEGKTDSDAWLAWWRDHFTEFEVCCEREVWYWFDPAQRGFDNRHVERRWRCTFDNYKPSWKLRLTAGFQVRALALLAAFGIPCNLVGTYADALTDTEADEARTETADRARKEAAFSAGIESLLAAFPELARALKKHIVDIDELAPGLAVRQLDALENRLGLELPAAYRQWLSLTGSFWFRHLDMRSLQIRRLPADPPFGPDMLCIGEYSMDADGDIVLFDLAKHNSDDPPVFYYCHEGPEIRMLAASFTKWLEALPRKELFLKSDE